MWSEITRTLAQYDSAVLIFVDAEGFPLSVRCKPQPDEARQVIRVTLPPGVAVQPGPASLMSHYHDEQLWNLRAFNLLGELEREEEGEGWVMRPRKLIPGMGTGMLDGLRLMRDARRAAQRYLEKRHLSRPRIDWPAIKRLHAEARKKH